MNADRFHALADAALAGPSGLATGVVDGREIIVVADVLAAEYEANGKPPLPPCPTLQRDDGRRVYLFALPQAVSV